MAYTNSPLVSYTRISPNKTSPRTQKIQRITIHCFVGQVTVERGCEVFALASRKASCNYVVAKDGKIGLVVEEKDRSWCTSSSYNDHRAVTIEVASDTTDPYAVTDEALQSTINLVADICKRNGIKKLIWINDKTAALAYTPKDGEAIMTVHRWYAKKACPGQYLMDKHEYICNTVNDVLNGKVSEQKQTASTEKKYTVKKGDTLTKIAKEFNVSGGYKALAELNCIKFPYIIRVGQELYISK